MLMHLTKRIINQILLHVFAPNFLGCAIYFLGRDITKLNMATWIANDTGIFIQLPTWIKYNAIDGLWLYSFLAALILLWGNTKVAYFLCTFFGIAACASEYLQYTHTFAGTGDLLDLIAYVLALFFSIFNLLIIKHPLL